MSISDKMIVVLVSGGRGLNNRKLVYETLDRVHSERGIDCILHGSCPNRKDQVTGEVIWSADMLAESWAKKREISYFGVPAKWNTGEVGGPREGPIRNQKMVDMVPHYAVIFPGGSGSNDTLQKVIEAKIKHEVING